MTNELSPLQAPYGDDVAEALAHYPQQDGYLLGLFRTFANSLRFLKKGAPNLLDKASPLPLRIREIVILRTTANMNCEYEWGVHVTIFASAARLSAVQIAETRAASSDAGLWSHSEVTLLNAVDQICAVGRMDVPTLQAFRADWTKEQQLEIFALCGTYHTISFVANNSNLPNEAFGARFPV